MLCFISVLCTAGVEWSGQGSRAPSSTSSLPYHDIGMHKPSQLTEYGSLSSFIWFPLFHHCLFFLVIQLNVCVFCHIFLLLFAEVITYMYYYLSNLHYANFVYQFPSCLSYLYIKFHLLVLKSLINPHRWF